MNPLDASFGTFANDFTGGASGSYPGAVPIDGANVETALGNPAKAIAYIRGFIKMPNGVLLRKLRVTGIIVPPEFAARDAAHQREVHRAERGVGRPLGRHRRHRQLPEPRRADHRRRFGAAMGGSATTYYLIVRWFSAPRRWARSSTRTASPSRSPYVGPETDASSRGA